LDIIIIALLPPACMMHAWFSRNNNATQRQTNVSFLGISSLAGAGRQAGRQAENKKASLRLCLQDCDPDFLVVPFL
jgi:hypothetical protein